MTMATFSVLCPNGRRQQVKSSLNKIMLEVLEEACKKQGFDSSQYGLKHGRQLLDLTVPIRFANLSNNAKLEMTKLPSPRAEASTNIALQLENGDRLQNNFPPSSSLWSILQHWNSVNESPVQGQLLEKEGIDPVCVYLRQEFCGKKSLQETTLRSLGLCGGRAAVRLLYQVRDAAMTEIESDPSSVTASEENKELQKCTENQVVEMEVEESPCVGAAKEITEDIADQTEEAQQHMQKNSREVCSDESLSRNKQDNWRLEEVRSGTSHDSNQRSAVVSEGLGEDKGSATAADIISHQLTKSTGSRSKGKQKKGLLETPKLLEFQDFKFPEQTRGAALYQAVGSFVPSSPVEACDREMMVYTLTGANSSENFDDNMQDDTFFEVTVNDVQSMIQNVRAKSGQGASLMTRAQVEALERRRLEQYDKTTVRVHFPDRIILQGFFKSYEKIAALYEWVKGCLAEPSQEFELYTTPPKQVLSSANKTFAQCGLVPASIIYCGSVVPHQEIHLRKTLLEDLKTLRDAETLVESRAGRPKTAQSFTHNEGIRAQAGGRGLSSILGGNQRSEQSSNKAGARGSHNAEESVDGKPSSASVSKITKNTPKWFKIGKK
ncbi:tether containing UBX domain for GLUT4-like isoform X2 [Corticium candelabrum]|uniref:tether containing UBX domain for GLUT4-like isoform X2 n=1 Tax=Corticium candelabrum TaxID=121492 RepID=UPI002E3620B2|nr:tether containing UBX domain for GLUT4-like isoform X2 [Corticium candelabrum]